MRLTDKRFLSQGFYQPKNKEERKEILNMEKPSYEEIYRKLGEYENRECHGKWLFIDIDGYWYNECSVCGQRTENNTGHPPDFNYCPYCGAKMDGGNDDG
jgi:hypothetical protein